MGVFVQTLVRHIQFTIVMNDGWTFAVTLQ